MRQQQSGVRAVRMLMQGMVGCALVMTLTACEHTNSDGNNANTTLSTNETVFPANVTLTSPLASTSSTTPASLSTSTRTIATADYSVQVNAIEDILNGVEPRNCGFQPQTFFQTEGNARCYGPTLMYENQPNAALPADFNGTLPGGDVGMWLANEIDGTGSTLPEACAAAQLNAKMRGLTLRSINALQVTASMKCVTNFDTSVTFPTTDGETADVVDSMNNMATVKGLAVQFTTATITYSVDTATNEGVYTYALTFIYDANDDSIFDEQPVSITLVHRSNTADGTFQGRLSYTYNDDTAVNEGNCFALSGGSTNVTRGGSFLYAKADDRVTVDGRYGTYCGYNADALSNGLVDPTNIYSGTNPTGWTDNFNWFLADFVPTTLAGNFAYAWQAGFGDGNTRVFNVHLDDDNGTRSGTAFFGFGDDITATDGSIQGMVCNWAGPNNLHTPLATYAQMQTVSESAAANGVFVPTSSALQYAPVNTCQYAAATDNVNGNFLVDLDIDGDLTDESHADITNQMQTLDADRDGNVDDSNSNGLADVFEDAGFALPISPDNFS